MIHFNKEQLYWIERTADIESALAMEKFIRLVQTKPEKLDKEEMKMVQQIAEEYIRLYTFLKELRIKCENERQNEKEEVQKRIQKKTK